MLLYCDTRLERTNCAAASITGATPARPLKALPAPAAVPPIVPMVAEAASLVVVMLMTPAESIVASILLEASLAFKSLRLLTVPLVPSPKVMLVAVPPPVAPIVSVRPPSAVVVVRAVVPAVRPSAVNEVSVPEMTRSDAVPVLIVSLPPTTDEAVGPVAPVMLSIAVSRSLIARVLPAPVPIVTLPEPSVVEVVCVVAKVMVLPLTVRTPVGVATSESELAVASSLVAAVIAAGEARLLLTTVPTTWALTNEDVPRRSWAVAPAIAAVVIAYFG